MTIIFLFSQSVDFELKITKKKTIKNIGNLPNPTVLFAKREISRNMKKISEDS